MALRSGKYDALRSEGDECVVYSGEGTAADGGRMRRAVVVITDQGLAVDAGGRLRRALCAHIIDVFRCSDVDGAFVFETDSDVLAVRVADGDRLVAAWGEVFPPPMRAAAVSQIEMPAGVAATLLGTARTLPTQRCRFPAAPPGSVTVDDRTLVSCQPADVSALVPAVEELPAVRAVVIPGKGRGLVALRDFSAGECLWTEVPRVCFIDGGERRAGGDTWREPSLRDFVMALDAHDATEAGSEGIDVGPQCGEAGAPVGWHRRFARVVRYNAWGYSVAEENARALFGLGSLLNHSCVPNARYDTKDGRDGAVFRAVRPIHLGDEVTVAYTQQPTRQRAQAELLEEKGFLCRCVHCTGPDYARRLRCAACSGAGLMPMGPEWDTWRCELCGCGQVPSPAQLAEEEWVMTVALDHAAADYSAEHHVAAIVFAARTLTSKHCAVALITEQLLQLSPKAGIPAAGFYAAARLLFDFATHVAPGTVTSRPAVAQALASCLRALQEGGMAREAVAVSRAAAEALRCLRGADDDDVAALAKIGALSDPPPVLPFQWEQLEKEVACMCGTEDFQKRVDRHVQRLTAALARRDDPPIGGWPPPGSGQSLEEKMGWA